MTSTPTDNARAAAEIVERLRKWQNEMERSSNQLLAYSDHNPEMREAAAGTSEVARTIREAADFIEAHMPSPDTHAAKVGDALEVCDWSGVSIGNKAVLKEAVRVLRAPTPQPAVAEDDRQLLEDGNAYYSWYQIQSIVETLTPAQRKRLPELSDKDFITWEGIESVPGLAERSGYMRQFGGHTLYQLTPLGKQVQAECALLGTREAK